MARKWIQSVNVEVTESGAILVGLGGAAAAAEPGKVVTVGAVSSTVLAANSSRMAATFVNTDPTRIIYLRLGSTAVMLQGIPLYPNGGSYEINQTNLYTGQIDAIANAAGGTDNLAVTEI